MHITLLGDSIFDNAPYVEKGYDLRAQLQARLGDGSRVHLIARDGDVLAGMARQMNQVRHLAEPLDWLLVSCGGNDVLSLVGAMHTPAATVLDGLELLARWQAGFRRDYETMLDLVLTSPGQVAVATIYDAVPGLSAGLRAALAPFNDVIVRAASARRLPVLDLRVICSEAVDYASASPIEPSAAGAAKIAAAIERLVTTHGNGRAHTVLYT